MDDVVSTGRRRSSHVHRLFPVSLAGLVCLLGLCVIACRDPAVDRAGRYDRSGRSGTTDAALSPPAAAFPDAQERRLLHQDLLAAVRRYHFFSAQTAANLGIDWEDSLRRLEPVFVEAQTPVALREAVHRLACSLHDVHLSYEPGVRGEELRLGLTLEGSYADGRAEFLVRSVEAESLRDRVRPGDVLVQVDGAWTEQLPRLYLDRTDANNWPSVTRAVAKFLTRRNTATASTQPGEVVRWRLRRSGTDPGFDLNLRWQHATDPADLPEQSRTDPDYVPTSCHPYASESAPALPDRDYSPTDGKPGGYRITGYGRNFCLYTAERLPYRDYPIIRHFSFFYYSRFPRDQADDAKLNTEATYAVAAEYFALSRLLRARPQTRGLILDLRDNGGGNDPEWFLDWYAPAPYEDLYDAVRVDPDRSNPVFNAAVSNLTTEWQKWYRDAAAGLSPGSLLKRPFKCLRPDCGGGNRFTPARALLKVPVVLLTGRSCHSSCAHFAHIFDENDFGPLVGEPSTATLTGQVYAHPVRTRSGLQLGQMGLAVSAALSGKSGAPIEGALSTVDSPVARTPADRTGEDAALIAAALHAFKQYPFPRHVAPLGP